tara:strand:- start:853 stop:1308 length:456 start_codon:yes stop_codon:yes gene_type:complete
MVIIPNDLYEIKQHHTYNHKTKHSEWTGLNRGGKVQGGELDKLRNKLPNSSWAWLLIIIEDNLYKLPSKQKDEWDRALLALLRCCDIDLNPKNAVYVEGEFRDYIANKDRDWKKLQKSLWGFLMCSMECLEYINYDVETNPYSTQALFEVA